MAPRFRRLALAAYAAGKPVVALKIGGSAAGAAAAVAHSARLAGDNASYHALFASCGVATVKTLEGLMTAAALLDSYGHCPGALGSLSTSGAGASLIADRCEALGVELAALAPETFAAIDSQKMFSRIGNPLDMGIFGGMRRSADVPLMLMNDPGVSVGLALVHSMNPWQGDPYRAAMGRARELSKKPLLVVTPGGMPEAERESYRSRGIDVFTDTDILLEAIGALLTSPPEPIPEVVRSDTITLPARPAADRTRKSALAGRFWRPRGAVDRVQFGRGRSRGGDTGRLSGGVEGRRIGGRAQERPWPGACRPRQPGCGGASLCGGGLPQCCGPGDGPGSLEAIAGISRADGVGLVLIAGLGGIFAEALRDVTTFPLPVSRSRVEAGLAKGCLGRVMTSPRWRHPGCFTAFVDLLMGLQEAALALGDDVQAIDINPVILGGSGATAVDALVVPRT